MKKMKRGATVWKKMFAGLDLEYIKNLVDQQYEEQPTEINGKKTWTDSTQKKTCK